MNWERIPIGELAQVVGGGTPPTRVAEYWNGSIPWFTPAEIPKNGAGVVTTSKRSITPAGLEHSAAKILPANSVLMTSRASIGHCAIAGVPVTTNQGFTSFVPKDRRSTRYLYYWAQQNREAFLARASGSTFLEISASEVRDMYIDAPELDEQYKIGEALRDIDDFIESLEQLINKKRSVKQGMMQQLLTGQIRLPGFTEEWKQLDVASESIVKARIGWQGLTTGEYRSSGTYRLVGGTEFREGRITWEEVPYVDKWRYDQDPFIQLRPGDILLTKDGTIGKTAFVDKLPGPATLNSGVFVIRPIKGAYIPAFLFYMLRSRAFEKFLARLTAGSTISHLYQRDLVTLQLKVPSTLKEQQAIAETLADLGSELSTLQAKLEKARDIKRGMMQQLLTGRIRLPLDAMV